MPTTTIKPRLLLFLLSLLFSAGLAGQSPQQPKPTPTPKPKPPKLTSHVILISISGFRSDYLTSAASYGLRIPTLHELQTKGAYAVAAESVYPSLSLPAHATLVSGMLPVDHGIVSDYPFDERSGNPATERHKLASEIKADTLWEAARRDGLTTASVGFPLTTGAAINFNLPEIPKIMDDKPPAPTEKKLKAISEALRQDELRIWAAMDLIEKRKPNLLMLHLGSLDAAQNQSGPSAKETLSVIERLDESLRTITESLNRAGIANDATLLIVSDHGAAKVERRFNPNAVLAKKGWLTLDAAGQITSWQAVAQPLGGAAVVFVKQNRDEKAIGEVEKIFREIHEKPDSPIWRIVTRQEVSRLGGDPRAAFYLEAAPTYAMSASATTLNQSSAGYLPQRSEMRAVFLASGRGIRPGAKVEHVRLVDIAPTIARLLGLELRMARGRIISEVTAQ